MQKVCFNLSHREIPFPASRRRGLQRNRLLRQVGSNYSCLHLLLAGGIHRGSGGKIHNYMPAAIGYITIHNELAIGRGQCPGDQVGPPASGIAPTQPVCRPESQSITGPCRDSAKTILPDSKYGIVTMTDEYQLGSRFGCSCYITV